MSRTDYVQWSLKVDVQRVKDRRCTVVFKGGCSACQGQKMYSGL